MRSLWKPGILLGVVLWACRLIPMGRLPLHPIETSLPAFVSPSPTSTAPNTPGIPMLTVQPEVNLQNLPHVYHRPENWNGKCILFVHGMGGSKDRWRDAMQAFEAYGFCTLAWDLPLHGERRTGGKKDPWRYRGLIIQQGAQELIAWATFLRQEGAQEVDLIAKSLGSIVAGVALGMGAPVDKAELLLAAANLPYVMEHGRIRNASREAPDASTDWSQIDPLYYLPKFTGAIHFHCGKRDVLLTPEACQFAYDAATAARERRLFWHDVGHRMPLELYFDEALSFFLQEEPASVPSPTAPRSSTTALLDTVSLPPSCGNQVCDADEDWMTCPWDCQGPRLLIGFQLHIEEFVQRTAYDQDPSLFATYADTLDALARVFEAHNAVLSIQTEKTFPRADVASGRFLLRDLLRRGHGVGVQSHLGHHLREGTMPTDTERLAYTRDVKEAVAQALGWEPTNLAGGFELQNVAALGVCPNCLGFISMTGLEKPFYQATKTTPQWLTPWILPPVSLESLNHTRWLEHDPVGTLVYLPGWYASTSFEIDCRQNPDCFAAATRSLMAALEQARPQTVQVWWCSSHLYQTGDANQRSRVLAAYDAWFTQVVDPLVAQGQVAWLNFDQMAQVYLRWEKVRQMYEGP